jgi:hypothetical protein
MGEEEERIVYSSDHAAILEELPVSQGELSSLAMKEYEKEMTPKPYLSNEIVTLSPLIVKQSASVETNNIEIIGNNNMSFLNKEEESNDVQSSLGKSEKKIFNQKQSYFCFTCVKNTKFIANQINGESYNKIFCSSDCYDIYIKSTTVFS